MNAKMSRALITAQKILKPAVKILSLLFPRCRYAYLSDFISLCRTWRVGAALLLSHPGWLGITCQLASLWAIAILRAPTTHLIFHAV